MTVIVTGLETPPPSAVGSCAVIMALPVMPLVTVNVIWLVLAGRTTLPATLATLGADEVKEIVVLAAWILLIETVSTEVLVMGRVSPVDGRRLIVGAAIGRVVAVETP